MNTRDLATLLPRVRNLQITRVAHLTDRRLILDLEWAGGKATATVDIVEVLAGEAKRPPRLDAPESLARLVQETPSDLSEAEARRRGLPPYWSAEWLEAQLLEHGTFRAIAAEVGVSEQVISEWGRRHGISRRPRIDRQKAAAVIAKLVDESRAGRTWPSIEAMVAEHRVSHATVERWRQAARRQADSPRAG